MRLDTIVTWNPSQIELVIEVNSEGATKEEVSERVLEIKELYELVKEIETSCGWDVQSSRLVVDEVDV